MKSIDSKINLLGRYKKVPLIPILFFTTLFTAATLFVLSMDVVVANQIIKDVEQYKASKGITPTVVQLRKFSNRYRSVKPQHCPCYQQLTAIDYELWYYLSENELTTYRSSSGQWY